MITLSSATTAALQQDAFEYAYLCELPGGLYFTNHGKDLSYDGQLYISNGLLTSFDTVKQSQELNLATYKVGLSNVDNTVAKAYLAANYRGQSAQVLMAIMLDGVVQGDALVVYKGTLDSFSVKENTTSSDLSLKLTSHWASYNHKSGRYSSDTLQQEIHSGDRIFKYAHKEQDALGWGER